jgi:hypothetical protein
MLDHKQPRAGLHRGATRRKNVGRAVVVPVVQNVLEHLEIAAGRHRSEEIPTYELESRRELNGPGADLEALRDAQRALSPDGLVPADGVEAVRRVLAASNEKVRAASFDLASISTNAFASAK